MLLADRDDPKPATEPTCQDEDGDGYGERCDAGPDCNDDFSDRHPGAVEVCDHEDQDCDGQVDEDFEVNAECDTACGVAGRFQCTDDGFVLCVALEIYDPCNGVDDDCDGLVDEDFRSSKCPTPLPGPCSEGLWRCTLEGLECIPYIVPGSIGEACNGLDDDCDGQADEGPDGAPLEIACYPGPPSTEDIGECRAGSGTCSGGRVEVCEGAVVPASEACDGLDTDCDGVTDEGCN